LLKRTPEEKTMGGPRKTGGQRSYLTIKADGRLHQRSEEGAEGAELYKWVNDKTGASGESWDIIFNEIDGHITGINFYDGDYGKVLNVTVSWDGGEAVVQMQITSNFCDDFLKKLPGVNLDEEVRLRPYSFKAKDNDKMLRGITVSQMDENGREWEKLPNHFYNKDTQENLHGYPKPEPLAKGEKYDKDDWTAYFIKVRKFLIGYAEQQVIPNVKKRAPVGAGVGGGGGPSSDGGQYDDGGGDGDIPADDDQIPF
jgi:hypothetical protein